MLKRILFVALAFVLVLGITGGVSAQEQHNTNAQTPEMARSISLKISEVNTLVVEYDEGYWLMPQYEGDECVASAQLEVIISPADTNNKTVTWESANPDLVSVDQNGLIIAHSDMVDQYEAVTITATTVSGLTAQTVIYCYWLD